MRASVYVIGIILAGARPAAAEVERRDVPDPESPPEGPEAAGDAEFVRTLELRLGDWEAAPSKFSLHGLAIEGTLAADALVYKAASRYLARRKDGAGHVEALEDVRRSLPRWKRYQGTSLLILRLRNERPELASGAERIFTLTEDLGRRGLVVECDHGEKPVRLPLRLAGLPQNLRVAKLRIQKFWTTADGYTRRAPPRDPNEPIDPASIGRKAKVSKPFAGHVLEKEPARIEVLLERPLLEKLDPDALTVRLEHWKSYEGPWEKDILDLNQGREWKELDGLRLDVRLPPGRLRVSDELEDLLEEARRKGKGEG